MLISVKLSYLLPQTLLLVFILGDGFALWRFRPDDAVWHYDLSSDSTDWASLCFDMADSDPEPQSVWMTVFIPGWAGLPLAFTHTWMYLQANPFTYTHTNVFTCTQKTFRLDVVEVGKRQSSCPSSWGLFSHNLCSVMGNIYFEMRTKAWQERY